MKLSEFVAIKQNYLQIGDISERAIETFSYVCVILELTMKRVVE